MVFKDSRAQQKRRSLWGSWNRLAWKAAFRQDLRKACWRCPRCRCGGACQFALVATTHDHNRKVSKQEKCRVSEFCPGNQSPRPRCQQGCTHSHGSREGLSLSLPTFCRWLLGVQWLVPWWLQRLPLSLLGLLFCVNPALLSLIKTPVIGLRAHLKLMTISNRDP